MYTRVHNVNRPNKESSEILLKILFTGESAQKLSYPDIPPHADDEESNAWNMKLLKEEASKAKPDHAVIKSLMTRTYPYCRQETLDATTTLSVSQMIQDLPVLKKWNYVSDYIIRQYVAKRKLSV